MRLMVHARTRVVVAAATAAAGIGVLGGVAPPVAAATTAPVPAIFAVGSRLTWSSGDATLEGAKLVPDPDGWLWRDGQWYRVESTGGSGGVGYEQIDVLSNTGGSIVGDLRLFLNTDLQQNINVPAGTAVVVGTPDGIGDYWVPPARLAALQDGFDGTTRIVHGQRQINGQTFDTVGVSTTGAGTYTGSTYDLASGLLLVGGTMTAGPGVMITDESGLPLEQSSGAVSYSHRQLVSVRQRTIPWASAPAPSWAVPGRTTHYQGQTGVEYDPSAGMPSIPGIPLSIDEVLDRSVGTAFVGRQLATSATAAGVAPITTPSDRAFSSAMFDGLWIPTDALAQLQPQQVLDQDPVTGQVVTFAGVQNNAAAIVLSGPADQVTQYYDLTSGLLVASTDRRPVPGSGTQVISVQFTGQE